MRLLGVLIVVFSFAGSILVCGDTALQTGETITIQQEWKGYHCGYTEPSTLVIQTEDGWKEVWQRVHRLRLPRPELPQIDFQKEMIIAVFMGKRSSGGYDIEIVRITETREEILVDVKEKEPPPGSLRTMALTQPYHIVVIRRSPLPVRFQPR